MTVKLLTEHRWEFLSLEGGCTDSSESTLVKMPHCWTSHVTAHIDCSDQTPKDTQPCNKAKKAKTQGSKSESM